jgi:hypothetical protein
VGRIDATSVAPVAGVVEVALTTPASDDGAVLFTVRGSVTGAVEPARSDVLVFSHPTGDGGLRIAVFGHGLSGRLVRLPVPDVAEAPSYGLSIQEVAGPRNRLRADLGAYRLAVAR